MEIQEYLRVAKRENNNKRPYLYVNAYQGKHIPVAPSKTVSMCAELAEKISRAYPGEKLLVTGFAETATALGALVASRMENACCYLHTTREDTGEGEVLYFTESHSHAVDQKLVLKGLDKAVEQADRLVFVEDEVTTGNTIEKLITLLEKRYGRKLRFTISSVLNSMTPERWQELLERGRECIFLHQIPPGYGIHTLEHYDYSDGQEQSRGWEKASCSLRVLHVPSDLDTRTVTDIRKLDQTCRHMADMIYQERKEDLKGGSVLVLGTEEFMYPAVWLGNWLEEQGEVGEVRTHSTTRSPIMVSRSKGYPLHSRVSLPGVYDRNRNTYLYNLAGYDAVVVLTDSGSEDLTGLEELTGRLSAAGNHNIFVYRWSYDEEYL